MKRSVARVSIYIAILSGVVAVLLGLPDVLRTVLFRSIDAPGYAAAAELLGGCLAEVNSHLIGFAVCSGTFAMLQLLLLTERVVRHGDRRGCIGSWTLIGAGPFFLHFLARCLALEQQEGEGVLIVALFLCYLPLLFVVAIPWHVERCLREEGRRRDIAATAATVPAMVLLQMVFEPSETGGPDFLLLLLFLAGLAAVALREPLKRAMGFLPPPPSFTP